MTGKEAIISKIISDAQKKVNSTNEEGSQKAKELIDTANNDARLYRTKNMEESYKEREDILKRRDTVARLEVKKKLLAAKQAVIDKVFADAVEEIRKDKEYKSLLIDMLGYAEDGDTVTFSEKDKRLFTKKELAEFAKAKGISIKVNPTYGSFSGGLILSGDGLDKNFSLEVELSNLRNEEEPEIARIIFEGTAK